MATALTIGRTTRDPGERTECPVLDDLLANGIDDLAKLRIMVHFCGQEALELSAESVAQTLGLWPVARTVQCLMELVGADLLGRLPLAEGAVYRLSTAGRARRDCLDCVFAHPGWQRAAFAALAARSVRRVQEEQRLVRRGGQVTRRSIDGRSHDAKYDQAEEYGKAPHRHLQTVSMVQLPPAQVIQYRSSGSEQQD